MNMLYFCQKEISHTNANSDRTKASTVEYIWSSWDVWVFIIGWGLHTCGSFLLPNVMHVHTHKQKSTFFNLKLYYMSMFKYKNSYVAVCLVYIKIVIWVEVKKDNINLL
jgi:hypothetical protein